MFDAARIVQEMTTQMSVYFSRTLRVLFDRDSLPTMRLDNESWQRAIEQTTAFRDEIRLLVRIANGEIPGDLADDIVMGEVEDAIESLFKTLFASPGNPRHYAIPHQFWSTELGLVIRHCQLWLRGDDLITYTEAVAILWPDDDIQVARMRMKRMVERGELTAYVDPTEANPQRAARVSREEVEAFR